MGSHKLFLYFLYTSFLFHCFTSIVIANNGQSQHQNYIIIVQNTGAINPSSAKDLESWHLSLLSEVCRKTAELKLIYSYNSVLNGFAARLTKQEVESMSNHSWFGRAILDDKPLKPHTTHTPEFLGLRGPNGVWKNSNMGEGIIIGIIDSGIYPDHPSFNDEGMPPPPAKWKGHCDFNASLCNNKLISAKSMMKAGLEEKKHLLPFDTTGHGTHTASTAAGAFVKNANINGTSTGTASGMAPKAHLAIYRVCGENGCAMIDTIKAIEEAINDGVDVISLSLGNAEFSPPLFEDATSIGGYFAMMKGVFVSCSAGNNGPSPSWISNVAPWVLTVAASTMDRQLYTSVVKLGNGLQFEGVSIYQPKNWTKQMMPLVYPGSNGNIEVARCYNNSLDSKIVRGKIVVCDRGVNLRIEKGINVLKAGGAGMILVNTKEYNYSLIEDRHVLPASAINVEDGQTLKKYFLSTKKPIATFLFEGSLTGIPWSPLIANFSARGPSPVGPLITKPDITGPGVDILAAIPPSYGGQMREKFGYMSGTSMSAPHLSGIAAIIKKAHPDWSPAAIKSAIMTTAYTKTREGKPIADAALRNPATPYDMGAGHVDPSKALDPGLVYDLKAEDYIPYLCSLRYNTSMIATIIHPAPPVDCTKRKSIPVEQLNYPSISVPLSKTNRKISIRRVVTNVGEAKATYKSLINVPKGVSAKVIPSTLQFTTLGQKKRFRVVLNWSGNSLDNMFGELEWMSNKHIVRSPIILVRPDQ